MLTEQAGLERASLDGLADGHPGSAHVLEFDRARSGMLQVANELGEDPRLVRVTDCLVPLLDRGLGADLAPRQVMQAYLFQLPLVHGQRMLARRSGQLIGDRQDRVKTLLASHVEIRLHLRGPQFVRAPPGRPVRHPRYGRPAQFLFTHHGRRLSQNALREELGRAAQAAGLGHVVPHQLRHTYATAMVNAGVSLQALMALLGHVSADMSLRYGKLFGATVTEYERALDLAKQRLGTMPAGRSGLPLAGVTGGAEWKDALALKSRLAGGFCLRAPAQGACAYASICEHCPSFRTDTGYLPVLAAQKSDAEQLARDAEERGWITEADRHRKLIARLDDLITRTPAG